MIISKTPFRISLFGGGTDFPNYYLKNEGCVIGGTIDKYCYVTTRYLPNVFDYKHRIVWSKNETVKKINEIIHPTVRSVLHLLNIKKGLEIHYQGDLQKNSGLGTSSSFCVGLLNSLGVLEKKKLSKSDLAKKAIFIEQKLMKEVCGSQDQIWAAYGGLNYIKFKRNGSFILKKLKLPKKQINYLNKNLFLIYTGIHRYSNDVEKDKILNFDKNLIHLDQIKKITNLFYNNLSKNNSTENFGSMLNEYWHLKKKLSSKVTNYKIDEIYKNAIASGASGGKIIGSGGGGFLLIYCKEKYQKNMRKRLKKLTIINFKFIDEGSKIIFKS